MHIQLDGFTSPRSATDAASIYITSWLVCHTSLKSYISKILHLLRSTLNVSFSTLGSTISVDADDESYTRGIQLTLTLPLQPIGLRDLAMSKMIQETAWLTVTVTCRMLTSPITKRVPISAFTKLTIPSCIQSPGIKQSVPCCALNILPEVVKTMRGMSNRIRRLFSTGKFVKGFPDDFLHGC